MNALSANQIKNGIMSCQLCSGFNAPGLCINYKEIGLSYSYTQNTPINILWVAESPPKPGNGFFYDLKYRDSKFRNALFDYINWAGLGPVDNLDEFNMKRYYLADAINCRWNKEIQKVIPKKIARTCAPHLAKQIELLKPRFIVFMGKIASETRKKREVKEAMDRNENMITFVDISFILTSPAQTKEERIALLKKIADKL